MGAIVTVHHLLLSHGLSVQAVRGVLPSARIGIVNNPAPIHAATDKPEDQAAARRMDAVRNRLFHDPIFGLGYPKDLDGPAGAGLEKVIQPGDLATVAQPIDWLGVNFYNRHLVAHAPGHGLIEAKFVKTDEPHTSIGWEVYPDALREVLVRIHRDWKPKALVVTENGAAYDDVPQAGDRVEDEDRRRFIESHLAACRDALREGVPLTGYFVWSLVDNFEWAEGYANRFGLVRMAVPGGPRVVKASGEWYGRFVRGELDR